jgi:hypothetical protein
LSIIPKNLLAAIVISLIFLSQTGCKKIIDDAISCTTESFFLYIEGDVDASNLKLFHFTFVNSDTSGDYILDNQIKWDFGDGVTETSQGLTIDHTYASTGSYTAKAS